MNNKSIRYDVLDLIYLLTYSTDCVAKQIIYNKVLLLQYYIGKNKYYKTCKSHKNGQSVEISIASSRVNNGVFKFCINEDPLFLIY